MNKEPIKCAQTTTYYIKKWGFLKTVLGIYFILAAGVCAVLWYIRDIVFIGIHNMASSENTLLLIGVFSIATLYKVRDLTYEIRKTIRISKKGIYLQYSKCRRNINWNSVSEIQIITRINIFGKHEGIRVAYYAGARLSYVRISPRLYGVSESGMLSDMISRSVAAIGIAPTVTTKAMRRGGWVE